MSTRWRCSPRSGPVRAARRAGRRAPGAREDRGARGQVPERALGRVRTRARGLGETPEGGYSREGTRARLCRCCSAALLLFRLPPLARQWASFPGEHTEAAVPRGRDDDSYSPAAAPALAGSPGTWSLGGLCGPGASVWGSRAAPQGGHLRLPSWEGPWASRALRLCGESPAAPSLTRLAGGGPQPAHSQPAQFIRMALGGGVLSPACFWAPHYW